MSGKMLEGLWGLLKSDSRTDTYIAAGVVMVMAGPPTYSLLKERVLS